MMGHWQVEQAALFYEFSPEQHIPGDHLLRSIDRFVDLGGLRRDLAPFYSMLGRQDGGSVTGLRCSGNHTGSAVCDARCGRRASEHSSSAAPFRFCTKSAKYRALEKTGPVREPNAALRRPRDPGVLAAMSAGQA
jgi:hypothetical protein